MDCFSRYIDAESALAPQAIRDAGLAAAPFPEVAGSAEIIRIGEVTGAAQADMWAFGHRQTPRAWQLLELQALAETAFQEGHDNVLIRYTSGALLWLPAEHEFFVLCAAQSMLDTVQKDALFAYDFASYLAEPVFSAAKRQHLQRVLRDYTVPGAGAKRRQSEAPV